MNFAWAVQQMLAGERVRLPEGEWNHSGCILIKRQEICYKSYYTQKDIYVNRACSSVASQYLESNNWELYKPPTKKFGELKIGDCFIYKSEDIYYKIAGHPTQNCLPADMELMDLNDQRDCWANFEDWEEVTPCNS